MSLRNWKKSSQCRRRRGFTLTELAVVFGIIGIIFAGIFTYASAAQSQLKTNQAADELGVIVNNVRSYYSGKVSPNVTSNSCPASFRSAYSLPPTNGVTGWQSQPCGNAAVAAALYNAAGIFPSEMLNTQLISSRRICVAFANNVWNPNTLTPSAIVDFCQMNTANPSFVSFAVRYSGLSQQNCVNAVMRTSALAGQTNLYQIVIGASQVFSTLSTTTNNGVITPASASSTGQSLINACTPTNAGGTVTVDWYYKLNG